MPAQVKRRNYTCYRNPVLTQIENLKSHPSVHSRILSGEVEIDGWVYDIGNGSIWAADPEGGRFEILGGAPGASQR